MLKLGLFQEYKFKLTLRNIESLLTSTSRNYRYLMLIEVDNKKASIKFSKYSKYNTIKL